MFIFFHSFIAEALVEPSTQCQALCLYTMWSLPSRDSQSSRVMGCFKRVQGMVGAQREADTLFNKGILYQGHVRAGTRDKKLWLLAEGSRPLVGSLREGRVLP